MNKYRFLTIVWTGLSVLLLAGCIEEVDLDLPDQPAEIVVDGYLNTEIPAMNYVILTRVRSYTDDGESLPDVRDASVYITPGEATGEGVEWIESDRVALSMVPEIADTLGLAIFLDTGEELDVEAGHHYRLEVYTEADTLQSQTHIPEPVAIDATYDLVDRGGQQRAFVRFGFRDPADTENYYRRMYHTGYEDPLLWGDFSGNALFDDGSIRGQEVNITFETYFEPGDTVRVFLNTMDRPAFRYMRTSMNAANTGGPFASPVQVESNVEGGRGGFVGMGVARETLIIEP